MTSQINPNNIDGQYPVAGQPNNTQGFRDNFTNIKTNFQTAATEITDLENKGVFKAALTGTTLDNNMADNLIYAVKLQDVSYTYVQQTATAGAIAIDYSAGQYQLIAPTANVSLSFTNFPASGSEGVVYVDFVVTNTAYTVTLPAAVSLGTTGIQGYSASVITFGATGTYRFGFSTVDSGTTIAIYDLNRPLNYYTNAVNVAATTASTSTTSGALIVAGGVGVGGNLYVGGNIIGNIEVATGNVTVGNLLTAGQVSATGNLYGGNVLNSGISSVTGNITGGNIRTAGLISAAGNITGGNILNNGISSVTGNITGGNIISGGVMSSAGNSRILSGTAVPAGGTAGAGYLMSSTANLGVFFGSGAPTLSAAQGSLYLRTDGSSTSTRMYVNTTGSTTWTAVTTAA
jgi:hypothetical protein